jgi:anti-anti-sigma factor
VANQLYAPRGRAPQARIKSAKVRPRRVVPKAFTLCLTLGRYGALVALTGEVDITAAADIAQLMRSLDSYVGPVHIDLGQVTFLDTNGLEPLLEAVRRRQRLRLPAIRIDRTSPAVRRLFNAAGLDDGQVLGDSLGLAADVHACLTCG